MGILTSVHYHFAYVIALFANIACITEECDFVIFKEESTNM